MRMWKPQIPTVIEKSAITSNICIYHECEKSSYFKLPQVKHRDNIPVFKTCIKSIKEPNFELFIYILKFTKFEKWKRWGWIFIPFWDAHIYVSMLTIQPPSLNDEVCRMAKDKWHHVLNNEKCNHLYLSNVIFYSWSIKRTK